MKMKITQIVDEALYLLDRAMRLIPQVGRPQVAPVPLTFDHRYVPTAKDQGEYYLRTVVGR